MTALNAAIAAFKEAPVVQPQAGKTYRILSASTYFKRQYEGSSMYQKGEGVRFHYTPQTEPEELWQFTPTEGGYLLSNLYSGQQLTMGDYNTAIKMTGKGTPIRMDKATIATKNYSYIPGVVTLSAVEGYSAQMTGAVKRLSAELSGNVFAKDEAALCYNGTWRIEEVTDYTVWLQGLVDKCELIILTAKPGEAAQPTTEALDFLKSEVIAPAKETLAKGDVSEEQYKAYMALYLQFQQMERTGIAQSLSEDYYYYLRNVWFGKYAAYSNASQMVAPMDKADGDHFLWSIVKRPGGAIYLINKATGTAAYPAANGNEQAIKLGEEYAWTLEERTLEGKTGIPYDRYHTYGLAWDETTLIWYVDGTSTSSSTRAWATAHGQPMPTSAIPTRPASTGCAYTRKRVCSTQMVWSMPSLQWSRMLPRMQPSTPCRAYVSMLL